MLVPAPLRLEHPEGAAGVPLEASIAVVIDPDLAPEHYRLTTVAADGADPTAPPTVQVYAGDAAGERYARTTLDHLARHATAGRYPAVRITDGPRFAYRGLMIDLARHFFTVAQLRPVLAVMAELKLNHLHLHLTDDQGWRLEIPGYPELTTRGAATQCGGGAGPDGGGYLTLADYRELQRAAADLGIVVVPEIDVPGHTNALLVAYPELAVAGFVPQPYEGMDVGFSQVDVHNEATYHLLAEVLAVVARETIGPYLHMGGDECLTLSAPDFELFIDRVARIAADTGKTVMGWHEMGRCQTLPPGTVGQYWNMVVPTPPRADRFGIDHAELTRSFVRQGGQVVLSPADVAYFDHGYREDYPLGQLWAHGPTTLTDSYEWEPSAILPDLPDSAVLGVAATCFTEVITTPEDLQVMLLPRLAALAELAWSPAPASAHPRRIADLAPRLAPLVREWTARCLHVEPVPEITP